MRRNQAWRRRRRGTVLAMMPWVLVICLVMLMLMVDLGHVFAEKSRTQNAADAASLAGAMQLRDKRGGRKRIPEMAIRFADMNLPDAPGALSRSDVEIGIWHAETGSFIPFPGLGVSNAVRVKVRRDGVGASRVGLLFARVFGQQDAPLNAESIAAFDHAPGGGGRPWTMPRLVQ